MDKKLKIILIDDDEPTNFLNEIIIRDMNVSHTILSFESAKLALHYFLNNSGEEEAADLILLDLNMPAMNGWEFLNKYSDLPAEKKAKVIVTLTTSFNPDDELRSKNSPDVNEFLKKPLTEQALNMIISKYF